VTVVGHQFITLTVDICVQHDGREAPRRAGLSAAAETCTYMYIGLVTLNMACWLCDSCSSKQQLRFLVN